MLKTQFQLHKTLDNWAHNEEPRQSRAWSRKMTEMARKLLDELLGPDRNKPINQKGTGGVKFYDNNVCKHYLVEFCPYELFLNTKSDMGPCPFRYHEESLRDKYKTDEGKPYRQQYESDFYMFIDKLVSDLERKLRRGKDRLDVRPNDPIMGGNAANDELEEKRTLLDLKIKEKLLLIEAFGEEGKIQEAQDLSAEVDRMRLEVDALLKQEADNPLFRLEKRMEVCQTCGAFLIVGDALKRIESHFEGRQHTGWARVRQTLQELRPKFAHNSHSFGRNESRDRYARSPPRQSYSRPRDYREQGEISDYPPRDRRHETYDSRRGQRSDTRYETGRNQGYDRRSSDAYRR